MKNLRKFRRWLVWAAIPAVVFACYEVGEITHPENAQVNSDIELTVKLNVPCNASGGRTDKIIFGILAPVEWDLANNATVTMNPTMMPDGIPEPVVYNEVLTVVPGSEVSPASDGFSGPWKDAFMRKFGTGATENGNKWGKDEGLLEWVVYESASPYTLGDGQRAEGLVTIQFRTTSQNTKVNMGYAYGGKIKGLDDSEQGWKILEVNGGPDALIDYTMDPTFIVHTLEYPRTRVVVDSPIEIIDRIKVNKKISVNGPLMYGFLAPKAWNPRTDVRVTLSTSGYSGGDVTDEQLTLVAAELPTEDKEPKSELLWREAMMNQFGTMGNYGDEMEWVVFRSTSNFATDGAGASDVLFNVKLEFTTGTENLKANFGHYAFFENDGLGTSYAIVAESQTLISAGGSPTPKIDYTRDPTLGAPVLFSTVPSTFRFGDFFSLRFDVSADDYETLDGSTVYFYATAVLVNNSVVEIPRTEMENVGGSVWQRYIYPKTFFRLGEGDEIKEVYFHVLNFNNSIRVTTYEGSDYLVTAAAE
jgi:hypothetical protein